jgi:hypothetical protein
MNFGKLLIFYWIVIIGMFLTTDIQKVWVLNFIHPPLMFFVTAFYIFSLYKNKKKDKSA